MTRERWPDPYDGAPHPDKSQPEDHDDVHPIAWRERQTPLWPEPQECGCPFGEGHTCEPLF